MFCQVNVLKNAEPTQLSVSEYVLADTSAAEANTIREFQVTIATENERGVCSGSNRRCRFVFYRNDGEYTSELSVRRIFTFSEDRRDIYCFLQTVWGATI